VKRDTPRPRSQRAAPSLPCPLRPSSDARSARESDPRADEHELRREATKHECSSGTFRSAEVDRTHRRPRRPWALPSAPGHARPGSKETPASRGRASRVMDSERTRCASPRHALHTEGMQGSRRARKPRRDRTRRGAGSGTRVVLGPRARDDRYDGRVSGSWTRLSKPETRIQGPGFEGEYPVHLAVNVGQLVARVRNRSPVSSGRRRHPEIDSIQVVAPPAASPRERRARGPRPRRGAPICWERASSTRDRGVRAARLVRPSRAGRQATAERAGVEAVEAGDG